MTGCDCGNWCPFRVLPHSSTMPQAHWHDTTISHIIQPTVDCMHIYSVQYWRHFYILTILLRGLDAFDRFSLFLPGETTFVTFCLLYCMPYLFWKGVHSRRKEFAPPGSKFFPFRVNHLSERRQKLFDRVTSLESVSIPLNYCRIDEV